MDGAEKLISELNFKKDIDSDEKRFQYTKRKLDNLAADSANESEINDLPENIYYMDKTPAEKRKARAVLSNTKHTHDELNRLIEICDFRIGRLSDPSKTRTDKETEKLLELLIRRAGWYEEKIEVGVPRNEKLNLYENLEASHITIAVLLQKKGLKLEAEKHITKANDYVERYSRVFITTVK